MKPVCTLIGENGNIFNLIGIARRALKEADEPEKANEMTERVMQAGSYDEAVRVIIEYVEAE